MTLSDREKGITAILLVCLLYGVLGVLAKGRLETWRVKREQYRQADNTLRMEQKLLEERPKWQQRYAAVHNLMPVFPADKPVDTYWLGVMDNAASLNSLGILKRQVSGEAPVGDAFEMAIECKEWEGSLDALVHFLHGLESAGVMLDMRQMFIRPSPDHVRLRGSFVLYCAYMREKSADATATAPAKTPAPAHKPPQKK